MKTKHIATVIMAVFISVIVYSLTTRKDVYARSTYGDMLRCFSVEKTVNSGDTIYDRFGIPFIIQ